MIDNSSFPDRDRQSHADWLITQFDAARNAAEEAQATVHSTRLGIYLEFESAPGHDLRTQSLEFRPSGIRLLNVRTREDESKQVQLATIYIPRDKTGHFLNKIQAYKTNDADSLNPDKKKPKNQPLVASIEDIRAALLTAFWTDNLDKMPQDEPRWVEVWLAVDADETLSQASLSQFHHTAASLGILEGNITHILKFPERWVLLLFANKTQLLGLIDHADKIAEFRAARETCSYFVNEAENREQAEWVRALLDRASFDPASNVSICILDSGINSGHPMIAPALAPEDMHTVNPKWGTHDHHSRGHGTRMAGIAIYGDVQGAIESNLTIEVRHKLESAKMLPPDKEEGTPTKLWGYMTAQGIYRAEIQAPQRKRIVCMAVTANDARDRGRPTSWSAQVDQLAAGSDNPDAGDNGVRRLILLSAGNIDEPEQWKNYPTSNATSEVHDPAQSWNALSVGAYTNLTQITHPAWAGYRPIALPGSLSPCSTTSCTWPARWPIKPEIVMEGGNVAISPGGVASDIDDLQLLSTWHKPSEGHFAVFGDTSAATAHAAYLAACIYAEYPDLWPETVRGLLVHSAVWTEAMKEQFKVGPGKGTYKQLLRSCGYGVPQLDAALYCLRNRLTLVSEAQIQPFEKKVEKKGSRYVTKDLHYYELPWPKVELEQLGGMEVKLRITLSYFIEPGPGEVGWKDKYRYASHGLRFDLNKPSESKEEFLKRVNVQARAEDEDAPGTSSPSEYWLLGSQQRDVGSIHSDIWTGTAAALASSNLIVIRPAVGWWRERHHLGHVNRLARYSLIVSIETPTTDVDIYTRIAAQITAQIATTVEIEVET